MMVCAGCLRDVVFFSANGAKSLSPAQRAGYRSGNPSARALKGCVIHQAGYNSAIGEKSERSERFRGGNATLQAAGNLPDREPRPLAWAKEYPALQAAGDTRAWMEYYVPFICGKLSSVFLILCMVAMLLFASTRPGLASAESPPATSSMRPAAPAPPAPQSPRVEILLIPSEDFSRTPDVSRSGAFFPLPDLVELARKASEKNAAKHADAPLAFVTSIQLKGTPAKSELLLEGTIEFSATGQGWAVAPVDDGSVLWTAQESGATGAGMASNGKDLSEDPAKNLGRDVQATGKSPRAFLARVNGATTLFAEAPAAGSLKVRAAYPLPQGEETAKISVGKFRAPARIDLRLGETLSVTSVSGAILEGPAASAKPGDGGSSITLWPLIGENKPLELTLKHSVILNAPSALRLLCTRTAEAKGGGLDITDDLAFYDRFLPGVEKRVGIPRDMRVLHAETSDPVTLRWEEGALVLIPREERSVLRVRVVLAAPQEHQVVRLADWEIGSPLTRTTLVLVASTSRIPLPVELPAQWMPVREGDPSRRTYECWSAYPPLAISLLPREQPRPLEIRGRLSLAPDQALVRYHATISDPRAGELVLRAPAGWVLSNLELKSGQRALPCAVIPRGADVWGIAWNPASVPDLLACEFHRAESWTGRRLDNLLPMPFIAVEGQRASRYGLLVNWPEVLDVQLKSSNDLQVGSVAETEAEAALYPPPPGSVTVLSLTDFQQFQRVAQSVSIQQFISGLQPFARLALRAIGASPEGFLEIQTRKPDVRSTAITLLSIGEDRATVRICLSYLVRFAPEQTFRFALPKGSSRNLKIDAAGLRESTMVSAGAWEEWTVTTQSGVLGPFAIYLEWPIESRPGEAPVAAPEVRVSGVSSREGFIVLEGSATLRLAAETQRLAEADEAALPPLPWKRENRLIGVYRYVEPPYTLRVTSERLPATPPLDGIVREAALVSSLSPEGEWFTRAVYRAALSSGRQFFEIRLPKGAELWSALVNGEGVKPAIRKDSKGESLLLVPLPPRSSRSGADVGITVLYRERGRALASNTSLELSGPTLPIPINKTTWDLDLPRGFEYLSYGGSLGNATAVREPVVEFLRTAFYPKTIVFPGISTPKILFHTAVLSFLALVVFAMLRARADKALRGQAEEIAGSASPSAPAAGIKQTTWSGVGFLIQLLIIVAIIAILAAIAVPNFLEAQVRSKVSRVRSDLRSLATGIESYYVDWNTYPPNADVLWQGPVKYLTSPFPDPYAPNRGETLRMLSGANASERMVQLGLLSPADARNPNYWFAYSIGPDGRDDGAAVLYDPTNGTISAGDIIRFKDGMFEGGWKPAYAATQAREGVAKDETMNKGGLAVVSTEAPLLAERVVPSASSMPGSPPVPAKTQEDASDILARRATGRVPSGPDASAIQRHGAYFTASPAAPASTAAPPAGAGGVPFGATPTLVPTFAMSERRAGALHPAYPTAGDVDADGDKPVGIEFWDLSEKYARQAGLLSLDIEIPQGRIQRHFEGLGGAAQIRLKLMEEYQFLRWRFIVKIGVFLALGLLWLRSRSAWRAAWLLAIAATMLIPILFRNPWVAFYNAAFQGALISLIVPAFSVLARRWTAHGAAPAADVSNSSGDGNNDGGDSASSRSGRRGGILPALLVLLLIWPAISQASEVPPPPPLATQVSATATLIPAVGAPENPIRILVPVDPEWFDPAKCGPQQAIEALKNPQAMISRKDFERLWNAALAEPVSAAVPAPILAALNFDGRLHPEKGWIQGTLEIRAVNPADRSSSIVMSLKSFRLEDAVCSVPGAALKVEEPSGQVLYMPARWSGSITARFTLPCSAQGASGSFQADLPDTAAAGQWRVELPCTGIKAESPSRSPFLRSEAAGISTVWGPVRPGLLQLKWSASAAAVSAAPNNAKNPPRFRANITQQIAWDTLGWATWNASLNLEAEPGEPSLPETIEFTTDPTMRFSLAQGASLREATAGIDKITLRLEAGREAKIDLAGVYLTAAAALAATPNSIFAPVLEGNSWRLSGIQPPFGVETQTTLLLKVSNRIQVDRMDGGAGLERRAGRASDDRYAFFHYKSAKAAWTVEARLRPLSPVFDVEIQEAFAPGLGLVRRAGMAALSFPDQPPVEATIVFPEGMRVLSVSGEAVSAWAQGGSTLRLVLRPDAPRPWRIEWTASADLDSGTAAFSLVPARVPGAREVRRSAALFSLPDEELAEVNLAGAQPRPVSDEDRRLARLVLSETEAAQAQPRAFTLVSDGAIEFSLSRMAASSMSVAFSRVIVENGVIDFYGALQVQPRRGRVRSVEATLRLPSLAEGESLPSIEWSGPVRGARAGETAQGAKGAQHYVIELAEPMSASFVVGMRMRLPANTEQGAALSVPVLLTEPGAGERAFLLLRRAFEGEARLADNPGARAVDPAAVSWPKDAGFATLPADQAFELLPAQMASPIQANITRHARDAALRAIVEVLRQRVILTSDGLERNELEIVVQNQSEQFLRIAFPHPISQITVYEVKVAGRTTPVPFGKESGRDVLLVPLLRTGLLEPELTVRVAYVVNGGKAFGGFGKRTQALPEILGGVPVTQSALVLMMPSEFRYMDFSGSLNRVELVDLEVDETLRRAKSLEKVSQAVLYSAGETQRKALANLEKMQTMLGSQLQSARQTSDAYARESAKIGTKAERFQDEKRLADERSRALKEAEQLQQVSGSNVMLLNRAIADQQRALGQVQMANQQAQVAAGQMQIAPGAQAPPGGQMQQGVPSPFQTNAPDAMPNAGQMGNAFAPADSGATQSAESAEPATPPMDFPSAGDVFVFRQLQGTGGIQFQYVSRGAISRLYDLLLGAGLLAVLVAIAFLGRRLVSTRRRIAIVIAVPCIVALLSGAMFDLAIPGLAAAILLLLPWGRPSAANLPPNVVSK